MKNYGKNKESSYIQYLLCGWAMSVQRPVGGFTWIETWLIDKKLNKFIKLIKNSDEESDEGYILEVDIQYTKKLHDLHSDLPFLSERMKINECTKLVCNLYDKKTMLFT